MISFFNLFLGSRRHSRRRRTDRDITVAVAIQGLEHKRCPSSVTLISGNLKVTSTDSKVELSRDPTGHVALNGSSTTFLARQVRTITINATNAEGASVDLSRVTRASFPNLKWTSINTGRGNDTVTGSFTVDRIATGDGDDTVIDSLGYDTINTGTGDDRIQVKGGGTITVNNAWLVLPGHCHRISGVETVAVNAATSTSALLFDSRGFSGRAEIFGSPRRDRITTGNGNDFVSSGGESDTISTNGGDDTIVVDKGGLNIHINAGAGNDFVDASTSTAPTSVFIVDGAGDDTYFLSNGNDRVTAFAGNTGSDFVSGYRGNDFIDYSKATAGSLFADGGDDDDTIRGGKGDDIIIGGTGINVLSGGLGFNLIDGVFGDLPLLNAI